MFTIDFKFVALKLEIILDLYVFGLQNKSNFDNFFII